MLHSIYSQSQFNLTMSLSSLCFQIHRLHPNLKFCHKLCHLSATASITKGMITAQQKWTANLTTATEFARNGTTDSRSNIGRVKDNERSIAAKFHWDTLDWTSSLPQQYLHHTHNITQLKTIPNILNTWTIYEAPHVCRLNYLMP